MSIHSVDVKHDGFEVAHVQDVQREYSRNVNAKYVKMAQ